MSRLIRFYSFLLVGIVAVSPFLGPTLTKHGISQSVLLVPGLVCGILLGYLVPWKDGSAQNRV